MSFIRFARICYNNPFRRFALTLLLITAASTTAIAQNDPFFGSPLKATPSIPKETGPALFGKGGASVKIVRQGPASTGYFHAAIASIAKASPTTLRKAISRSQTSGYKVDFADGTEEFVHSEDLQFTHTHHMDSSEGEWVAVLMSAYAEHALRIGILDALQNSTTVSNKAEAISLFNKSGLLTVAWDRGIRAASLEAKIDNGVLNLDKAVLKQALTSQFKALGISTSEYPTLLGILNDDNFYGTLGFIVQRDAEVFAAPRSAVEVGLPVRVLQAFMGSGALFTVSNQEMTLKYLGLTKSNQAMVASTRAALPAGLTDAPWWVSSQAYSVMDYDPAAQTITLRNPQGTIPAPDGVFTIPLDTFNKAFETCSATSNE